MSVIWRLLRNRVLLAIIDKLLDWFKSEAARFASEYLQVAIPIVKEAALMDVPGPEKFRWAGDKLRVQLTEQGIKFRNHWVDTAIQAAVGAVESMPR